LIFVAPDTSPRGEKVPGDPASAYDFGLGAGFYVDATQEPFARNYRMWSYVAEELPKLVAEHFPADAGRQSILGHSMGGHGALTAALRHPDRYRAANAFAPIVAPSQVPWGIKALGGYLGDNKQAWRRHDAVALIEDGARFSDRWWTMVTPIVSGRAASPGIAGAPARRRTFPSPFAASQVTTTATSSRPSWPIICAGMPRLTESAVRQGLP
jgi:S-formylglutathione hydrolase FrmB